MIFCIGEIEQKFFCFTWHCVHIKALEYLGKKRFLSPPKNKMVSTSFCSKLVIKGQSHYAMSLLVLLLPMAFQCTHAYSISLLFEGTIKTLLNTLKRHPEVMWGNIAKTLPSWAPGYDHTMCVCVFCLVSVECFVFRNASCLFLVIPGGYLADITGKKGIFFFKIIKNPSIFMLCNALGLGH